MLNRQEKTFILTPFVVAYPEGEVRARAKTPPKVHKPGAHLSKDEATREVLNRIVHRVKKI